MEIVWRLGAYLFALQFLGSVAAAGVIKGNEWKPHHSQWGVCQDDRECIVVDAPCGTPQSINKAFELNYHDWWSTRMRASVIDCKKLPKSRFKATCRAGFCSAELSFGKP